MPSLATMLGLRTSNTIEQAQSLAGYYMIFHFLFAYAGLSSRTWKQAYGIDHNVSPREDLTKYGTKAVSEGKITQKQLDQLKRIESCSANSVEHYPLFVGAILWAHVTEVSVTTINGSALVYTLARMAYAAVYIFVDAPTLSQLRGISWWVSNIVCLRLFWLGADITNGPK